MENFEDFIKQPWRIKKWEIGGVVKITAHGFSPDHHLKIEPGSGVPWLVNLTWKNRNGEECSLQALSFREENGTLHDTNIQVSFAGHSPISAEVTLSIDPESGALKGTFGPPKRDPCQEGNTGTFAADADPPRGDHGASGSGRHRRALVPA